MVNQPSHLTYAKDEIQAAFDLGEVPPSDTLERATFRVDFTIDTMYDREPDDNEQPLADMLTDLIHWADVNGVNWRAALGRANRMVEQERAEWGLR